MDNLEAQTYETFEKVLLSILRFLLYDVNMPFVLYIIACEVATILFIFILNNMNAKFEI